MAAPGEILVTETVVSLTRRMDDARFEERGVERFKGIEKSVRVIEVHPEGRTPGAGVALRRFRRRHVTKRRVIVGGLVAACLAALGALGATQLGGTAADGKTRVALVIGSDPRENTVAAQYSEGLLRSERRFGIESETFVVDNVNPSRGSLEQLDARLRDGDFDVVLWAGYGETADALTHLLGEEPDTRFVYVDASLEGTPFEGSPNVTAVPLDSRPAARLGGYLSGLMEASRADGPDGGAVSVVGGIPVPAVFELVNGFRAGARRALRSTDVRVDYSNDFLDESVCESIANRQIDAGSGVVFAAAGDCGTGALVAAGIRGVWGVGVDRDQSHLGPHILASVVKRFDHAAQATLQRYLEGTLPAGEDVTLGLDDDAVGLVGINPRVPQAVRKKVAAEAARLRLAAEPADRS